MSSIVAFGSATNPGAGGSVVSTGALGPGKYKVTVVTMPGGTLTSADANNVQLQAGATVIGTLVQSATSGLAFASPDIWVDVPAGAAISVTAVGAASGASAVYRAQIVATVA